MMCSNINVFPYQDELVAVSEKSVLRVADLLDWLVTAETAGRTWTRGTRAIATSDCDTGPGPGEPHPPGPGGGLDLSEIEKIRTELGKILTLSRDVFKLDLISSNAITNQVLMALLIEKKLKSKIHPMINYFFDRYNTDTINNIFGN